MEIFILLVIAFVILIIYFIKKGYDGDKGRNEVVNDEEEDFTPVVPLTTQVSAKLSPELYKKFNGYCEYKGVSKTSVIKEAIDMYLKSTESGDR